MYENQLNELLVETEIAEENREDVYEKLTTMLNGLSSEHQEFCVGFSLLFAYQEATQKANL